MALVAIGNAAEIKRVKRGDLHGAQVFQIAHNLPTKHVHVTHLTSAHAVHNEHLTQAGPLAQLSGFIHAPVLDQLNAAHLVHPAPAIPIAASPAIGHYTPVVHHHLQTYHAQPVYEKVLF